jgi:Cu(I)/Ag(I) efflux system membrane fusion protein
MSDEIQREGAAHHEPTHEGAAHHEPTHGDAHHEPMHEGEEAPPRGVAIMAVIRWLILLGVALTAGAAWWSYAHADPSLAHAPRYQCPMHPQITSSDPGECPICHMDLEPIDASRTHNHADHDAPTAAAPAPLPTVYRCPMHADQQSLSPGTCAICKMDLEPVTTDPPTVYRCPMHADQQSLSPGTCAICKMDLEPLAAAAPPPPGTAPLQLGLDRLQAIGVRTAPVVALDRSPTLRAPASLQLAERGAAEVHVRAAGFLEKIHVSETGVRVHKGQHLADLYSPEIYQAQTELLAARGWSQGAGGNALAAARQRLELLGMHGPAIDRVLRSGKPTRTVELEAPAAGVIVGLGAVLGAYATPETTLYRIRDRDTLYVIAEVPAGRGEHIAPGTKARLTIPTRPDFSRDLDVDLVYPELDREARSFRVRLTIDDPSLRAGEYGLVDFALPPRHVLAVPRDALVATGSDTHVFVDHGGGRLEPRRVTVGEPFDEQVEIRSGLTADERVVAGATFLVDAESRLRAALVPAP